MNKTQIALLGAAMAGLMGASAMAGTKKPMKGEVAENVPCYGINKCAGHGKCGGAGHACAGNNTCKGEGWLKVPKDVCEEIQGGSLTPPKPS
jgi:uncharacterized membrane protein